MNGSFEEKYICPHANDEVKDAKHWNCIDTGYMDTSDPYYGNHSCSPEYINTCSTFSGSAAPANTEFYQYPRSGNGMFDVGMYDNHGDTNSTYYHRDYLMGHLSHPLVSGQSYCVTFYVVMSNRANYAVDHMGAYLDDGSIDTVSKCGVTHTEYTPQVYATSIINDSVNWTKIQGSFIANGMERYITIGNFFDTAHTDKIQIQTGGFLFSMYEVDDVSVIASNAQADAGRDTTIYAEQTATIGVDSNGGGMPCYWYELGGGIAAIDSGGTIEVHPTTTTSYVVSMDLCGTVTYDTVTVNVTPCPAITAAFTDTGSTVRGFTYTGTTALIDSVKWNFGDGHADTALNPVHTYTANGTYHVCVTVYTICGSDSACSDIIISGLGAPSVSPEGRVMVWPNPVGNELHITNAAGAELRIYDMVCGSARLTRTLKGDQEVVNTLPLPPGMYILQLTDATTGERVVRKIIKE